MRTISNILIVFLIFTAGYFSRFDLKGVYTKMVSTIDQKGAIDAAPTVSSFELNPENQTKIDIIKKIINTPEPLRALDPIITGQINNQTLTRAGIINSTNINRKEESKLPPLKENSKLNLAAEKKIKDMFTGQYFEHTSPVNGKGVGDLGADVGYDYVLIGENLALGNFKDDSGVVTAWMDSPGHRANILNNHYTEIGVAVGQGTYEGRSVWMAVQHFGTPKDACPTVDKTLDTLINLNQNKINEYDKKLSSTKKGIDSGGVIGGKTTSEQIIDYNTLANEYNSLIKKLRTQVENYNSEVIKFNACINLMNS